MGFCSHYSKGHFFFLNEMDKEHQQLEPVRGQVGRNLGVGTLRICCTLCWKKLGHGRRHMGDMSYLETLL